MQYAVDWLWLCEIPLVTETLTAIERPIFVFEEAALSLPAQDW